MQDDEADLDDRELPDESDMDDEDEPEVVPCPYCGKGIAEEAQWCHHCGKYISRENKPRRPGWLLAGTLLLIVLTLVLLFVWGG